MKSLAAQAAAGLLLLCLAAPAWAQHRQTQQENRPPPSLPAPVAAANISSGASDSVRPADPIAPIDPSLEPQPPDVFAASLPRCWWARQVTTIRQAIVTYDCRVSARGVRARCELVRLAHLRMLLWRLRRACPAVPQHRPCACDCTLLRCVPPSDRPTAHPPAHACAQIRSPALDGAVEDMPVRNLTNTYLHGFAGSTSSLLSGLSPLVAPAQPLVGQVPVLEAEAGALGAQSVGVVAGPHAAVIC